MGTPFGIGSNRTIFSDGEAITSGDLTDISKNVTRRAWEIPGAAELLAFDRMDATYNVALKSATALKGRNLGVFTVGGGLCPTYSANNTGVGRGAIGIWNEEGGVSLPAASGDGKMLWGMVDTVTSPIAVAHDNPATDLYRWDLISVYVAEADVDVVVRDYKDATTGAETSEEVIPAKKVQFAYSVTKGAEGSVNNVAIPALPSGERYLYAVKLTHGSSVASVVEILDLTIPLGDVQVFHQVPSHAMAATAGIDFEGFWNMSGDGTISAVDPAIVATASLTPPPQLVNPNVRILGVTLSYEIENKTGAGDPAEIKLLRRTADGATADVEVADLTSRFTYDGTKASTHVDLRGLPGAGSIVQPMWGNGKTTKEAFSHPYDAVNMPIVRVKSPSRSGSKCLIYGITWFAVGA